MVVGPTSKMGPSLTNGFQAPGHAFAGGHAFGIHWRREKRKRKKKICTPLTERETNKKNKIIYFFKSKKKEKENSN